MPDRSVAEASAAVQTPSPPRGGKRRIPLSQVMQGAREVILLHNGDEYTLRITSNQKLILTK